MKYLFVVFFFVSSFVFAEQQYKTHRVKSGETVYSIAEEYNVPVSAIYKLNPDAKSGISPNTTLIIPPAEVVKEDPDVSFRTHKVKKKETLYSLSQEYNVSIEDIKRYNKFLYAEPLKKGATLRIPNQPKLSTTSPAITQAQAPPKAETTREHVVLPQETMYGISKSYGLTVEELAAMNPWVDTLKPGMMLTIKLREKQQNSIDTTKYKIYKVQPQETLYSLTREMGISRDSLFNLNPELRDGLKAGMLLKLPKEDKGYADAQYFSESENLEYLIKDYSPKNLVLMLPFKLNDIQTDSLTLTKERIRKDQVLQISLDFYAGVLMALDSAKSKGISVNMQVFDTQQDPAHVRQILFTQDFSNVDAVIGPLLQEVAEATAEGLRSKNIPVVSPLSTKKVSNLKNFVQTRPTAAMMEEAMINYLKENAPGKNVILIAENNFSEIKNKILQTLGNVKVLNPSSGAISTGELSAALKKGTENWIILEAGSIGLISSLTSRLNALADAYNITLLTTDRNKSYDNESISNYHLGKLNFHFPSIDKEYDPLRSKNFVSAYEKIYGVEPNQYAVRGFDITYDVLLRLAAFGDLYKSFELFEGTTEYAENKFNYEAKSDGGYYNTAMYIIKYDENLNRNVVK